MTSQMPQGAKKPACTAHGLIFAKVASPILLDAVLLVELIHAAAGIDELLLAGVERVALGANLEMFCFVERVSYTAPQAQRIVVGW